jgi:hypothetical protein
MFLVWTFSSSQLKVSVGGGPSSPKVSEISALLRKQALAKHVHLCHRSEADRRDEVKKTQVCQSVKPDEAEGGSFR